MAATVYPPGPLVPGSASFSPPQQCLSPGASSCHGAALWKDTRKQASPAARHPVLSGPGCEVVPPQGRLSPGQEEKPEGPGAVGVLAMGTGHHPQLFLQWNYLLRPGQAPALVNYNLWGEESAPRSRLPSSSARVT